MKIYANGVVAIFGFALASCAHHRDVRPGANGLHRVAVAAEERDDAQRSALMQAEHYCESLQKHHAIVSENTKYTGTMDEATRDTIRKASKAAAVVGGASQVGRAGGDFDHYGEPGVHVKPANPLSTAGAVGSIMTGGKDYVTEMTFKCE